MAGCWQPEPPRSSKHRAKSPAARLAAPVSAHTVTVCLSATPRIPPHQLGAFGMPGFPDPFICQGLQPKPRCRQDGRPTFPAIRYSLSPTRLQTTFCRVNRSRALATRRTSHRPSWPQPRIREIQLLIRADCSLMSDHTLPFRPYRNHPRSCCLSSAYGVVVGWSAEVTGGLISETFVTITPVAFVSRFVYRVAGNEAKMVQMSPIPKKSWVIESFGVQLVPNESYWQYDF